MYEAAFDPCKILREQVETLFDQGLTDQAAALSADIDRLQVAVWQGRMETVV